MTPTTRWLLGVMSGAPLALLIASLFAAPILLASGYDRDAVFAFDDVMRLASLLVLAVTVTVFVVYVQKSSDSRLRDKRPLWTTILLLGHVIALPVFWFLYMSPWNRTTSDRAD